MASGIPSSRRTMSATRPRSVGRTAPRRTRAARSRNTSTAGDRAGSVAVPRDGVGSGARRKMCSAASPRGSRLVTSTASRGQAASSLATRSRAASRRCSQLSTTNSLDPSPSRAEQAARTSPRLTVSPIASARANGTAAGSMTGASSSTVAVSTRRATSIATRVFPIPPGPTTVTSRSDASSRCSAATSASRPNSGVAGRTGGSPVLAGRPATPPATARSAAFRAGDGSRPVSSTSRRR